ncbi:type VII secretion protein EccCa [Micromonospora sp. NPDC049559]|uniref:type VII secretion protein EccCa n=1 Tax=Micromonospora sp. NPDC049559 TaxID=3155923 RepID=UPI003422F225
MTTRLVHRPARATRPPAETAPRPVESPPTLPDGKAGSNLLMLLPAVGIAGSLSMMLFSRGSGFAVIGALVLVVALAASGLLMLSQRGQAARARRQQRERYLDYLEELRESLAEQERAARVRGRLLNPSVEALFDLVRDPARRWERRRGDADFLAVRVGLGTVPVQRLDLPDRGTALVPTDPFMLAEARAMVRRFGSAPGMPLVVPLDRAGDVSIVGPRESVLRAARALLCQLAALHAPDDVALALAHPPDREGDWAWVRWLPHVLDPERQDGTVPLRRIAADPAALRILLHDELTRRAAQVDELRRNLGDRRGTARMRRLVVVHDTYGSVAQELALPDPATSAGQLGVTVLHLVADRLREPDQVAVRLTVGGTEVVVEELGGPAPGVRAGRVDPVTPALAEGLARLLAPLRLSPDSVEEHTQAGPVDVVGLLGADDPARLDVPRLWRDRGERGFLRVPIGVDDQGRPVVLDLKESAQLGMGPHGLCVGATGSGKSELLRMLVLALAMTHPPERVAMVLIDYKGGATFAPFGSLPHVAGVITNLEDDAGLVERVYASLDGEVKRRQQVLRDGGNIADVADYHALRAERPELPPLPHLLVIIDEFGELLTARPDFIELFLTIGRIGRSIGIHLLLSSQRIEGGKLRGLDAYLSYRLGLRTFSESESRTVLETPDAFHLPPLPGFGFLKVDTTIYQRFKGGYVSGRYRPPADRPLPAVPEAPKVGEYRQYNAPARADDEVPVELPERSVGATLMGVVIEQLAAAARPVHQIWLPPMPALLTLDRVAGPVRAGADGLAFAVDLPPMRIPLGLVDDPARQRQGVWALDLTDAGGHLAVIGGPQSGKTTLLRTLVTALALTHTPRQVAVYGVDLVGSGLGALGAFPHVGGVAGRGDRERVRRTVEEVRAMLEQRERLCRELGVDSVEQLRARHARGEVAELPSADVLLVVDGIGALRDDFEELEPLVADLLQRGGGYGVHVVATMLRWNDVRIALQATFGSRVELRLGDPSDSSIARRLAETIRTDQPGRALTTDQLFAQVALPRIDGVTATAGLTEAVEQVAGMVRRAWPGEPAPAVRVLPHRLPARLLPDAAREPVRVPIGVDELALHPVGLDLFGTDQHLLVLGDDGCGKTNLLRLVAHGLVERYTAKELALAVMDPRGLLRDVAPEEYVGGYGHNPRLCASLAVGVAKELAKRVPDDPGGRPPADGTTDTRIVVLIDDYDLLTATNQRPLEALLPYLPAARDLGLHVVVTRRVAGASRALYDPFLLALRENGATGLVMAGERAEGQLFPGVHAGPQPAGRGWWVRRGEPVRLVQTAVDGEQR